MDGNNKLGQSLKQARQAKGLTLFELSRESGVSPSHLGRVERGERFPSGLVLRRLAKPLGYEEADLLILAGFMDSAPMRLETGHLDPYVASVLSQEPVKVQRAVVSMLVILKMLAEARELSKEEA